MCVRADQQLEGVDVFNAYVAIVQWSTTNILLLIRDYLGMKTRHVNYTNTFVYILTETEVYIKYPKVFEKK